MNQVVLVSVVQVLVGHCFNAKKMSPVLLEAEKVKCHVLLLRHQGVFAV
jgi:hypothetical protein